MVQQSVITVFYNERISLEIGGYMGTGFDCNYGEEEITTVASGIDAIKAVLFGDDIHAKERLLTR